MIIGIGTDIVEVSRVMDKLKRSEGFKNKIFAQSEIDYCESRAYPAMHYAARWAVKEAYLKASGVKFIGNHHLSCIVTCHDEHGKPYVQLLGKEAESFYSRYQATIHLSISHTKEYATAYVIIEKNRINHNG